MTRYDFHTGLTNYEAAMQAARDALADDEIRMCEDPQIIPYSVTTRDGRSLPRWKITLRQ